MILETSTGKFIAVTREFIRRMDRSELISHLESRGMACYDDESTSLLRETALDDYDNEANANDYSHFP